MAESSIRQSKKNNHDNPDARTHTTVSSDTAVASEGGAYSAELLKGGDFSEAAFERHVSHLSDSRLSQPAYVQRRALIIRQIQRDYGNQYVQRLVNRIQTQRAQGIQTRLTVGPAGDEYEREADRVAKQVVGMSQPVQRQGPEEEEEELQAKVLQRQDEEEELQMKPILRQMGMEGGDVEPDIEQSIQHARGSGEPIPDDVRSSMEGAFGADFSGVKVHTGSESDALNNSLSASAFTTGQDIFVRRQDYNPGSRKGQELLAHELTHVVQQNDVTVQRDDNRHEASHGNRYAQRRLQYHMNDRLDFLTENYPKQAGEIKAFAYSKYGFQYKKGGQLTFSLTDKAMTDIQTDVGNVCQASPKDLNGLKSTDDVAKSIVAEIESLDAGDEKTEALKTMHIFLYVYNKGGGITQLLAKEPRLVKEALLKEAQSQMSADLYNLEIFPSDEIGQVLKGATSLTNVSARGLNEVKNQWAKLKTKQDKKEYITKRIVHEASKGYNRRYLLVSTPLEKFVPFGDMFTQWWFSPSKGAIMFPAPGVNWDQSRADFVKDAYKKYQSDVDLKPENFTQLLTTEIANQLIKKYQTLGLEWNTSAFEPFYNKQKELIQLYLAGADLPNKVVKDVSNGVIPYLVDLTLLEDDSKK